MSEEAIGQREPGLSHPLRKLAVSLTDDGRVLIQAGDNAGIIIDEVTGAVCIFGTEIRFVAPEIKNNGETVSLPTMNLGLEYDTGIRKLGE